MSGVKCLEYARSQSICVSYCVHVNVLGSMHVCFVQLQERQHFVIMDVTYQGFVSGNMDQDAVGLRKMVADGNFVAVCQSFSKNMSLYGEEMPLSLNYHHSIA